MADTRAEEQLAPNEIHHPRRDNPVVETTQPQPTVRHATEEEIEVPDWLMADDKSKEAEHNDNAAACSDESDPAWLKSAREALSSSGYGSGVVSNNLSLSGGTLKLSKGGETCEAAMLEVHYAQDKGTVRVIPGAMRIGAPPYIIGRTGGARDSIDLALPEPHISAKQASIVPPDPSRGGARTWTIHDHSTNGTLVNGHLVGKGRRVELLGGERLHFGKRGQFPYAIFYTPELCTGLLDLAEDGP